mmetsp:Transcript_28409/g.65693  ORF Transcript_28409/g.65693 Transcript_28409/m.65693 type:complete len:265 (-) Transcript_28409:8-802(-)
MSCRNKLSSSMSGASSVDTSAPSSSTSSPTGPSMVRGGLDHNLAMRASCSLRTSLLRARKRCCKMRSRIIEYLASFSFPVRPQLGPSLHSARTKRTTAIFKSPTMSRYSLPESSQRRCSQNCPGCMPFPSTFPGAWLVGSASSSNLFWHICAKAPTKRATNLLASLSSSWLAFGGGGLSGAGGNRGSPSAGVYVLVRKNFPTSMVASISKSSAGVGPGGSGGSRSSGSGGGGVSAFFFGAISLGPAGAGCRALSSHALEPTSST